MHINITTIILFVLALALAAAYYKPGTVNDQSITGDSHNSQTDDSSAVTSPFSSKNQHIPANERLGLLEQDITQIKHQLKQIELVLQQLNNGPESDISQHSRGSTANRSPMSSSLNRRLFNIDNLTAAGIDHFLASDIVRRKNAVELKRLELQDHATRNGYLNSPRYFDELEAINRQDVSLRDELGDDLYDEYLYSSKQNNRVKIASVMLGSAAEQAGIREDDIVLSYDVQRIFTWRELKSATTQGELGEYILISIYRDGEIFTLSVPRGPLGIQLGATRMQP